MVEALGLYISLNTLILKKYNIILIRLSGCVLLSLIGLLNIHAVARVYTIIYTMEVIFKCSGGKLSSVVT